MTLEQLSRFLGNVPRAKMFYPHLVKYMPQYGIDTPKRVCAFLAQAAHESWGFTSLIESTNYKSVESLMKTWPKRFPTAKFTEAYVGQPQKIANYVYANRMGNGAPETGDGYRYRGRGIFQNTGKDKYREFGLDTLHDPNKFVNNPELLGTEQYAVQSACWFWKTNSLNKFADADDFEGMTKRINGALIGLADRIKWHEKAKQIFI